MLVEKGKSEQYIHVISVLENCKLFHHQSVQVYSIRIANVHINFNDAPTLRTFCAIEYLRIYTSMSVLANEIQPFSRLVGPFQLNQN